VPDGVGLHEAGTREQIIVTALAPGSAPDRQLVHCELPGSGGDEFAERALRNFGESRVPLYISMLAARRCASVAPAPWIVALIGPDVPDPNLDDLPFAHHRRTFSRSAIHLRCHMANTNPRQPCHARQLLAASGLKTQGRLVAPVIENDGNF
jgi:hypothetical protein